MRTPKFSKEPRDRKKDKENEVLKRLARQKRLKEIYLRRYELSTAKYSNF